MRLNWPPSSRCVRSSQKQYGDAERWAACPTAASLALGKARNADVSRRYFCTGCPSLLNVTRVKFPRQDSKIGRETTLHAIKLHPQSLVPLQQCWRSAHIPRARSLYEDI